MNEELTTEDLADLRIILISFMADKEPTRKYHAWKVKHQNFGGKLIACISINRKKTKIGAEEIIYFDKVWISKK